jgi:hypothetical protein
MVKRETPQVPQVAVKQESMFQGEVEKEVTPMFDIIKVLIVYKCR